MCESVRRPFGTREDNADHDVVERARSMSERAIREMRQSCLRHHHAHRILANCVRRLMSAGHGTLALHAIDESPARVATMKAMQESDRLPVR